LRKIAVERIGERPARFGKSSLVSGDQKWNTLSMELFANVAKVCGRTPRIIVNATVTSSPSLPILNLTQCVVLVTVK